MTNRDWFPRTVKPRKNKPRSYPVVAIARGATLAETGETETVDTVIGSLPARLPTIFAKRASADFLAELNNCYKDDLWNWRVSSNERQILTPNTREVVAVRMTVTVHFFGWRDPRKRGHNRYHLLLDPVTFYGRSLDEVWPGSDPVIERLLKWAVTLRDWCHENSLLVKPTNGGLAGQLLRDARFYPNARRKVPAQTNAVAREHLPGNHYHLFSHRQTKEYSAIYLDQRRAHHYHARTTRLPNSNSLFAYGDFVNLESVCFDSPIPDFAGLYCLYLRLPKVCTSFSVCPTGNSRVRKCFVWSNEVSLYTDLGYTVEGIIAAWGSHERDEGIPAYAKWAERELDKLSDPAWLKPLLLSTYGILAVKPRAMQSVYAKAKRGESVSLFTGHQQLHGWLVGHTNGRQVEPGIANVLHRGLIESATRAESLGLAHYLDCKGYNVLSIYADAVIVETPELPLQPLDGCCDSRRSNVLLPDPWRIHTQLNHLQLINSQSFVSGEMTKLPGVNRELLKVSRGRQGKAPTKPLYEALSGQRVQTNRRI